MNPELTAGMILSRDPAPRHPGSVDHRASGQLRKIPVASRDNEAYKSLITTDKAWRPKWV